MELVEGALGESADFRIATYGMESRDGNSLKPSPFNTSSDSLSDRDDAVLALQKSLQVAAALASSDVDFHTGLHMQVFLCRANPFSTSMKLYEGCPGA